MDKIFITNLQLEALIGIYANERTDRQPIALDIEMTIATEAAITHDSIQHAVDYAAVVERIKQWVLESRFHLIESLADFLAKQLRAEFRVSQVLLRLRKFPEEIAADTVGVVVER